MKLKVYLLALFITLSGTSIYAQEGNNNRVTVEDQEGNSEYKENDEKYRELYKNYRDLISSFKDSYKNMLDSGFSKTSGDFSKEGLSNFISEAGIYKNNIKNNSQVSNYNTQLNDLAKVTSRSGQDYVAFFENSLLPGIDGDIANAKSILKNIETNESKKEVSLGFSNTNSSSSNTNTDNSYKNSNSNSSANNKRSISERIAGTWVVSSSIGTNKNGIKPSYYFSSNGTGYMIHPDQNDKCPPYYYKAHLLWEVNDKGDIKYWFTKLDVYCGNQLNVREIYPNYYVIDSNEIFGNSFTQGETYVRM